MTAFTVSGMSCRLVAPSSIAVGPGPHPAASPFDKRVSEALGVRAFEVYPIELPPGESTVRHDHQADRVEDVYAFTSGSDWVVVNDERVPVHRSHYVAVSLDAARHVQAGGEGLVLQSALCSRHPLPEVRSYCGTQILQRSWLALVCQVGPGPLAEIMLSAW
jgi:hypothetical protein